MEQEKLFKILAAMFLMRSQYHHEHGNHKASVAYDNAFDMLVYAEKGRWDCLLQFGFADEAEQLIDKIGADIDYYDLEEIVLGNGN